MTDLASPVWAGAAYRITQPWGPTTLTVEPLLNGQHFHAGIDIGTPLRTPLFSPVAGKVVHVSSALLAITNLADCFWLVHIDSSVVTLSQWVSKGQLVAYSGNKVPTGGATTGPHLHFEVQNYPGARFNTYDANGRLIYLPGALNNPASSLDPIPVLSGRFSSGAGDITPKLSTPPRRKPRMAATSDNHNVFCRGGAAGTTPNALFHNRFDEASQKWIGWQSLGGVLGEDEIEVTGHGQRLDVYVVGTDQAVYHCHSNDAGASWSALESLGGVEGGKSLVAVGPGAAAAVPQPKAVSGTFSGTLGSD